MDAVEKKPNKEAKLTAEVKVDEAEPMKEKEIEKGEAISKKKIPKLDECRLLILNSF